MLAVALAPNTRAQQDTIDSPVPTISSSEHPPVADLQRRRGVLRGMLHRGGTARQTSAWQAELAVVEATLASQVADPLLPQCVQLGASFEEPQAARVSHSLWLAHADSSHPTLSDQQLTALLRDALEAQGNAVLRPLLGRVSWHLSDDSVTLVCTARDLQIVTAQLCTASWLALTAILPERSLSVTVQIGEPVPVDVRPSWLDERLWGRVPLWLRSQLVGSVLVNGRLYGATLERTADLGAQSEIVVWLLDQVVGQSHDALGFLKQEQEAGRDIGAR